MTLTTRINGTAGAHAPAVPAVLGIARVAAARARQNAPAVPAVPEAAARTVDLMAALRTSVERARAAYPAGETVPDVRGHLVDRTDLVSGSDVAETYGVTRATVCNWHTRYPSFPRPVATPGGRPVWLMSEIQRWHRERVVTITRTVTVTRILP